MSLFKEKRMLLLALVALLAVAIIYKSGIRTGIDLSGGSRLTLKLEASEVTIRMNETISEDLHDVSQLATGIADNLLTSVKVIAVDRAKNEATFEVGQLISSDVITSIVENNGTVVGIENKVSDTTRDGVVGLLLTRIDPNGLLGVQARPAGTNLVIFEIPTLDPSETPAVNLARAEALLTRQGRLEAYIENVLVLAGADIESVGSISINESGDAYEYEVPLRISQDGANRFATASAGKGNYPFVIYLDRPEDAVLLFNKQILNTLPTGLSYDNTIQRFHVTTKEPYGYNLLVPAFPIDNVNLSEAEQQAVQEIKTFKASAILLGDNAHYSENVVATLKSIFSENNVKFFPSTTEDRTYTNWINRACGLQSAPAISVDIAGKAARDVRITGARSTYASAEAEANDLKNVLSQRLPVRVSIIGESSIPARLGEEFANEIKKTALAAVAVVGALVFIRYRRPLIVGAIMLTMGAELLITLGFASAIHQTIGLAEIGGLLAVIGTGVEQQLIITDEVLRGEIEKMRSGGIMSRVGRAFSVIFAAAATTIAAMVMLFFVGYGAMKGFAIVTTVGILIAVIVTRPAYGRMVNAILGREVSKAGAQVKPVQ